MEEADSMPPATTPPDVLALRLEVARQRLEAAGFRVEAVVETSAWRPEPPPGAELRVVRQRSAGPGAALLAVAPFRPPAGGEAG
jgi:hypothetical protein